MIRHQVGDADECRTCGIQIWLADDGAWNGADGACSCGIDEHEPGGFSQYAADQRARETPWLDDPDSYRGPDGVLGNDFPDRGW